MGKIADFRQVPVENLIPYQANAKMHSKEQVEKLKNSIKTYGFLSPCLIDKSLNLIAGHGRLMAAKELGMTEVPCVCIEDLTEEERRAYIIADNRLTELGEWDRAILSAELAALRDEGFNIEMTGFTIDDILIEEIDFSDIDEAWNEAEEEAEAEKTPKAKHGDVFQLGRHRLMCGDSTSAADVEKLRGGQLMHLTVTDPPYNVDYSGHRKERERIKNDNKTDGEFYRFLLAAFTNIQRSMKPGRSFYIWHASTEAVNFMQAARETGLDPRQILIWVKNSMVIGRQDYNWRHEPCIYGWTEGASHYFTDKRNLTTVFDKKLNVQEMTEDQAKDLLRNILEYTTAIYENRPMASEQHPTMKPINLIKKQIENSSKPGERVLDLFGGSGTTLIAAEQTDRICYMMEYSPVYVDAIIERWENFTGQKAELIPEV